MRKTITMLGAIAAVLLLAARAYGGDEIPGDYGLMSTGPGGTATADIDMDGKDIKNLDDIYSNPMSTDAAAAPTTVITTTGPFQGVNATNTAGADLVLAPASGGDNLSAFTRANIAEGEAVVITSVSMEGVVTTTTLVEGADNLGANFNCSAAASDIACVCLIYDAAVRNATTGEYAVYRTDATCSDERLAFFPLFASAVTAGVTLTDTAPAFATVATGTDGQILLAGDLSWPGDADTYVTHSAANSIVFISGGVESLRLFSSFARLGVTLNAYGKYTYDSLGILQFGAAMASTHSLGTGTVGIAGALEVDGDAFFDDRIAIKNTALADGDATPSVAAGSVWTTPANTAPTVITDLDDPTAGQIVTICIGSATNPSTIADAGNFNLSAAWNPGIDDCITLYVQADNDYIEISRSDN